MCEVIIYGDTDFELYNGNWSADDKRNAMVYLKTLESFEFIFSLVTLQRTVQYLREAATKLQGNIQDIASGVVLIEQARKDLNKLRTTVDGYSHRIFEHSSSTAEKSNTSLSSCSTVFLRAMYCLSMQLMTVRRQGTTYLGSVAILEV